MKTALALTTWLTLTTPVLAAGPPTLEPLMTLNATLGDDFQVDPNLDVSILSGGEVSGPKIKGKIISPSADWLRTMPSGNLRMDVRALIKTNDGQLIYVSYNGVIRCSKEINDRLDKGGLVKADECYWISSPTFETSSANYSWLNNVVAVGKMSEINTGGGAHIKYEVYSVR